MGDIAPQIITLQSIDVEAIYQTVRAFKKDQIPVPRALQNTGAFTLPAPTTPLDIEIGAGVGTFALQYAAAHPERFLIALEHTRTRFNTFKRTLDELKARGKAVPNLCAIQANAIGCITHALPPLSVDRYLILYPNPEPKNLAARWHAMPFFSYLLATLKPGGTVELVTNIQSYAVEAREYFCDAWGLTIVSDDELSGAEPLQNARTLFEKKYLERGEVCYRLVARKNI